MSKKVYPALDADFVREVLDYAPLTGLFRWRSRHDRERKWNTRYAGKLAGTVATGGYVRIQIGKGMHYPAHVLAWLYVYGEWRPNEIDHRHGNRADNRISELRIATSSENGCNKTMQSNNTSGFVGVSFHALSGQWQARITKHKKTVWSSLFPTRSSAAMARSAKLIDLHGEFAVPNPKRSRYRHHRDHGRPPGCERG